MILRIREARVCGPHALRLTFNDGTVKQVDVRPLLEGNIFEPLRDPAYFATMTLDSICGTVVWPNGADLRRRLFTSCRPKPRPIPRPERGSGVWGRSSLPETPVSARLRRQR